MINTILVEIYIEGDACEYASMRMTSIPRVGEYMMISPDDIKKVANVMWLIERPDTVRIVLREREEVLQRNSTGWK